MAAILHRPLLRVTCFSTMDTNDFLSQILPNDDPGETFNGTLPTLEDITFYPQIAIAKLTGKTRADVTPEEAFELYTKAVAKQSKSGPLYKHVKSNFVRVLEKGYIVEVQEISRIKDPGVLVGLNEYDHPGARIPLANGKFVTRHPDAIVFFTDNVGYASCRPSDPSVIRRMDAIKDSFDVPKEQAIDYNTGFEKEDILKNLYECWTKIKEFCITNDITDGSVSLTELERWAQCVKMDDYSNIFQNGVDCVIRKASSDPDEQHALTAVLNGHLKF